MSTELTRVPVVPYTCKDLHLLLKAMCEHGRFEFTRLSASQDQHILDDWKQHEGKVLHIESTKGCDVVQVWTLLEWMRSLERQTKLRAFHEEDRETRRKRLLARDKAMIMLRALLNADAQTTETYLNVLLDTPGARLSILGLTPEEEKDIRTKEKGWISV